MAPRDQFNQAQGPISTTSELANRIATWPSGLYRVSLQRATDSDEKRRWVGAGGTSVDRGDDGETERALNVARRVMALARKSEREQGVGEFRARGLIRVKGKRTERYAEFVVGEGEPTAERNMFEDQLAAYSKATNALLDTARLQSGHINRQGAQISRARRPLGVSAQQHLETMDTLMGKSREGMTMAVNAMAWKLAVKREGERKLQKARNVGAGLDVAVAALPAALNAFEAYLRTRVG